VKISRYSMHYGPLNHILGDGLPRPYSGPRMRIFTPQ